MPIRRSAVALMVLALGGSVSVQGVKKKPRSVECDALTDVKYRIAETTRYCKGTKGKAAFKLAWDVTAKAKESVRIDVERANGDEIFSEISQSATSNEIEIPEVLCSTEEISICVSRWNKKGRALKMSKKGDSSDGDSSDEKGKSSKKPKGDSSDGDSSDGDSSDGTKCCQKVPLPQCPSGFTCKDPILQGLRGQNIKWVGEEGGWYALFVDEEIDMQVNVRTTGPLPEDFPDRQYVTGVSILQHGHSLVIEVVEPYSGDTPGCPESFFSCLADGGLRVVVDGKESQHLARPTRNEKVGGIFELSSSNLPVECREFGGGEEWDLLYEEMRRSHRELAEPSFKEWVLSFPPKVASEWELLYEEIRRGDGELAEPGFEEWLLSFPHKVAPEWCVKYVSEIGLADVQSKQSVLKIATADIVVRFSVGVNHRHGGKTDRLGRELPELDFWQSSVGLSGINLENEHLTGMLGETSRPVQDSSGHVITKGVDAIRGTVADYRVSGPAGKDFRLLHLDESTTP